MKTKLHHPDEYMMTMNHLQSVHDKRPKILSSILVFIGCIITAILVSMVDFKTTINSLTIEFIGDQEKSFRLYYDTGNGYNDHESVEGKVLWRDKQLITYHFAIPSDKTITAIRIDLYEQPSQYVINTISVNYLNDSNEIYQHLTWDAGQIEKMFVPLHDIKPFVLQQGHLLVETNGADPYFGTKQNISEIWSKLRNERHPLLLPSKIGVYFLLAVLAILFLFYQYVSKLTMDHLRSVHDKRPKILSSILVFIGCIISAILVSMVDFKTTINSLTIEFNGDQEKSFRLYYDTGNGYNDQELVEGKVLWKDKQSTTYHFPIPSDKTITAIRIDPDEQPSQYVIKTISVNYLNDSKEIHQHLTWDAGQIKKLFVPLHDVKPFVLHQGHLLVETNGADPYFGTKQNLSEIWSKLRNEQHPLLLPLKIGVYLLSAVLPILSLFYYYVSNRLKLVLIAILFFFKRIFRPSDRHFLESTFLGIRLYRLIEILLLMEMIFFMFLHRSSQPILSDEMFTIGMVMNNYVFLVGVTVVTTILFYRNKWISSLISILIALSWILIISPTLDLLQHVGIDSMAEAKNFDWSEAGFFISTIWENIDFKISRTGTALNLISVGMGITIYILLYKHLRLDVNSLTLFLAGSLVVGFLFMSPVVANKSMNIIMLLMDKRHDFQEVLKKFENESPRITFDNRNLIVVVYIGESTSMMNMQIYGYPRQTTPELERLHQNDKGLLLFRNVFSTHTHTTPSLLEAMSIGIFDKEDHLPINERRRVPVIDVLSKENIRSYLISNQGQTGTWNQYSSIIFKNADKTFSTSNKHLGNKDNLMTKPFDHIFFSDHLIPTVNKFSAPRRGLIFLHSYTGHGPYLEYIPVEFRKSVDLSFASLNRKAIMGSKDWNFRDVDAYDATIKYIDFSVVRSIEMIKSSDDPMVFIYFSDHGESVYSWRGHESSRFIHEMARVPFLLYFNSAARKEYPTLFKKYNDLSRTGAISTLAQFPSTLIDMLGGDIKSLPNLPFTIGSVQSTPVKPIIVRRTSEGLTYVNLNQPVESPDPTYSTLLDATDDSTAIFSTTHHNSGNNTKICYHQSNSIGKAVRGSLVADCLEVDLVVQDDGTLSVSQSPLESVNLHLSQIIDIANRKNLSLWIDAKNLHPGFNCSVLADYLVENTIDNKRSVIEFPSHTPLSDKRIQACSHKLQSLGFRTSYYVSKDKASLCSNKLADGKQNVSDENCRSLQDDLENAYRSKIFTDFSFDYDVVAAMENIPVAKKLRWNTWNVQAKSFEKIHPKRFDMVILSNNDPNSR
jgi:glucan phosphoethanolaminetransferase (alkaline phosphatase superfamily)